MPPPTLLKPGFMKGTDKVPIDYIIEICLKMQGRKIMILKATTGSGKSTVMPAKLAEFFPGKILSLQPRVFNAIDLPNRILEHYKMFKMGENIGYKTGNKQVEAETGVMFYTNGSFSKMLETMTDDDICEYSIIILDEAHELDLLALFLHYRFKKFLDESGYRSDSPIFIVTSATFDQHHFAKYYGTENIYEVEGYTYPIEERFLKYDTENYYTETANVIATLPDPGDVLVFVAGQAEMDNVRRELVRRDIPDEAILELNKAIIDKGDKRFTKIFMSAEEMGVKRKIILATNVGETGITYPYLKIVVDTGYHKNNLYHCDYDVYTLKNEPISWFSAQQRKGRVGRESPGIFYGIYSEETYRKLDQTPTVKIYQDNIDAIVPKYGDSIRELLYVPSEFSLWRSYEKLFLLGYINSDLSVNPIYKILESANLTPEAVKIIITGYYWDVPINDLIVAAIATTQNQIKYKSVFTADVQCDFLTAVQLFYDYSKGQGEFSDKHINTLKFITERRDEIIKSLAENGFNPYKNYEYSYPNYKSDYVKKMKQCIYEGLRFQHAIWNGEYYETKSGFNIYMKQFCHSFVYSKISNGQVASKSVLDNFVNYSVDYF